MNGTRKWSTQWYAMTVAFTLTVATFAGGGRALAQETVPPPMASGPPPVGGSVGYFGERGQVVISGDFKFNILRESLSSVGGSEGGSSTSYELQPALDYFVSPNISVGAVLGLRRDVEDGANATSFTLAPRVGYNFVLTNAVSLWVRLGLGYQRESYGGTASALASRYAIPVSLYAPILWHPATHFFIGIGPFFARDVIAKSAGEDIPKRTDIGLSSTIGGYFGGL